MILFGGQHLQVLFFGNLNVYTHTVGIETRFIHQLPTRSRDTFQVDIAIELMNGPEVFGNTYQAFHRVIGITYHSRTEEQAFNVITAIEFDGQVN